MPEPQQPAPVITSMGPESRITNSTAFDIQITGSNFTTDSRVYFNNRQLETTYVSTTELRARIVPDATVPQQMLGSSSVPDKTEAPVYVSNEYGNSSQLNFRLYSNWSFDDATPIGSDSGWSGEHSSIVVNERGELFAAWIH